MKKCSKCNIEKELILFGLSSRNKDKKRSQCKECDALYRNSLNENKNIEYRKEYYKNNKEKLLLSNKEYRLKNIDSINTTRIKNKDLEKIKSISKSYYLKNKSILNEKSKNYQKTNKTELREKSRLRLIDKRKTDPIFKLKCNIRRLIQLSFKSKGFVKNCKTFEILGCDATEFKKHLERKFEPWMSWDNKGLFNGTFNYGWDLDHIIPLKKAETKEDVTKLNHYTNFQPLYGKINREIKNGNY